MRSNLVGRMKRLLPHTSGNATMLVAFAMPVLIGGAGIAVDISQWYMWKRELQFAVDQAAMAGAWARSDSATESTYVTRATQEFNANLAATQGNTTTPVVELANYAGGTGNSVAVHATVSHELPFSGLLTGNAPNIYAYAQAVYEEVMEAYLSGLEQFCDSHYDSERRPTSVASFFVSRVDTKVDTALKAKLSEPLSDEERAEVDSLRGTAAIANAKLAYQRFLQRFAGPRWARLAARGR